jgi:hypothetical protein
MLNLFNSRALAEQTSFYYSCAPTAVAACDGFMFEMGTSNLQCPANAGSAEFWKVALSSPTSIKSIVFIGRDSCCLERIQKYIVTIGNNSNIKLNPICVELGTMSDGGWYFCPTPMIGITFGLFSTTSHLNFLETMAYSQEALQMNAGVSVSYLGTNSATYPVSNAL